jgi:aldehyde dehydrogenase (NAD+)
VNPTDGAVLAKVHASSQADYDTMVERAQAAYQVWRTTPAPRRGEAVRLCAEALRTHKDALVRWSRWRWASRSRKATAKSRK